MDKVSTLDTPVVLFNQLTKRKETFLPLNQDIIKLATIGYTPYGVPHLGIVRSSLVFQLLQNTLAHKFKEYRVTHTRTKATLDRRVAKEAIENKLPLWKVSDSATKNYEDLFRKLEITPPQIQVSSMVCIHDILGCIRALLRKERAYISLKGYIFFDSSKGSGEFGDARARFPYVVDHTWDDTDRRNCFDFPLWIPSGEGSTGYDSPSWGRGTPSFELSSLLPFLMTYNNQTRVDIYGGGVHYLRSLNPNQILILEAFRQKPVQDLVGCWLSHGLVTSPSYDKLSNQDGSVLDATTIVKSKIFASEILKLSLIRAHYSCNIIWTPILFSSAEHIIKEWFSKVPYKEADYSVEPLNSVIMAMRNDLDTPTALKEVDKLFKLGCSLSWPVPLRSKFYSTLRFLGIDLI